MATEPSSVDWSVFVPREKAVIAFVRRANDILLIHKRRGLGAGKVNGPGGRLEEGESPEEAAVRETREEVGLEIDGLRERAVLHFAFTNGYSLTVHVFVTGSFSGTPTETDEADPFWVSVDEIPYASMWADDAYWLPEVLADRYVVGRFVFEDDTLLWSEMDVTDVKLL